MSDEIIELFDQILGLKDILSINGRQKFFETIKVYLTHGKRETEIGGRTIEFLRDHLIQVVNFLDIVGLNQEEIIEAIYNMPSIINDPDDLYLKYLVLGVIENEDNTFRKHKLVSKTKEFRVGLKQILKRYKIVSNSSYNKFTWNVLVHSTNDEFASIFTRSIYEKPYQLFDEKYEALAYIEDLDISDIDLDSFRELDVNKELVEKYEKVQGPRKQFIKI